MSMVIDSHCHLNYPGLQERQLDVLAEARARGVEGFVNISTRAAEWDAILATAHAHDDVWATIGIHPHDADSHAHVDTDRLVEAAVDAKVIGIGETGLDYYYDKSDRERQRRSFRSHLVAARTSGLPVIVHTRDAEADTLELLREQAALGGLKGVIHCFTASQSFAEAALELGFYISLSGIVTFKNAKDLQSTAATIPADRLLVETDSPFLAPVPHRGKTCEPAFVVDTAGFIAGLRGVGFDELAQQTTANFFALFRRAAA